MARVEVSSSTLRLALVTLTLVRPRGAHVNPERWNKITRSERQSSYSDESDSDEFSSREASLERLTPKSLIDDAETTVPKKSNTGSTVADSNADISDAEAEYLASEEEEEYEVDPFEQELSDGLSSADDSSDIMFKVESRDPDRVKDEVKSDQVSPPKIESEERSWHSDWNADGYSSPFATKLSVVHAPEEVYNPTARVHATPFGQKVLNAMRSSQPELVSEPSTTFAEPNPPPSLYERPSSPSDAALFKASSVAAMTKAELPQIPLNHDEGIKSAVSEEEGAYNYFASGSHRRNSTPQPYSTNISHTPEILNMSQSYYQSPFQMPSYRDSVESIPQKSEETPFGSFGYGAYPQPSRPVAPAGYRWSHCGYTQEYPQNEAVATTSASSQPYWRNTYCPVTPSSQSQTFPIPATHEDAISLRSRACPKPTMLTISEIVSEGNSGLSGDPSRGTKRKADDMMDDDSAKCQATSSVTSENITASSEVILPDAQPQEDIMVTDEQSQALPARVGDTLQSDALAVINHEGPARKKSRTGAKASMLKATRTFVSGMVAGGLSVFGALLVYGATAPDSIQDRVRLELS